MLIRNPNIQYNLIGLSFADDIYRITTKTGKQRLIPLYPVVIYTLIDIPVIKRFLFLDQKTGRPYKKCRLWRIFNRAKKRRGSKI